MLMMMLAFAPRSDLVDYDDCELPQTLGDRNDAGVALADLHRFEAWIARHLRDWVELHRRDGAACGPLLTLMKKYHVSATSLYKGNPESMSIMMLVSTELWMA